ncbi:Tol-Pal system-associated acyl-CoA thioesterase [hydrothermal vent metagenome]|uniref:Tol-Pal system-associated acyl-CoA thioesterase n=1 Tax=hydrothermal vent metagenome TaxID=652676 RepID=A0A3B0ZCZ5_9ZZZZ
MTEFAWPVRVYYEDTDAGGVVYHANYLHFMERARTEWLRAMGFEQDELKSQMDVLFAVRSMNLEYYSPARFNDSLMVTVKIINLRGASMMLEQDIKKENESGVLCQGKVRIVCLTASSFRPCPIPTQIQQLVKL